MRITRKDQQAFTPYGGPGITKAELWRGKHDVTFELFQLKKGAAYPEHLHDCWETMYIVSGRLNLSGTILDAGDFVFTEPGEIHVADILDDTVVLLGFGKTYG